MLVLVMRHYDLFRLFLGADQHHHLPALHSRELFDYTDLFQIIPYALEEAHPEFLMRHLPAAEAQGDLRLVALGQEANEITQLDLIIAIIGVGPKLDFFDLNLFQLQSGLVLLFRLPVFEFAVIHDSAYRGLGGRRDFDQVHFRSFRFGQRFTRRHDPNLFTVNTN